MCIGQLSKTYASFDMCKMKPERECFIEHGLEFTTSSRV